VAALDADGNLLWYRSLVRDYPDITNQVGMAASPVLWKDVLLLPMENAGDSFAAALDANTGKNLWRSGRFRDINWVTPLVVEQQGGKGKAEVLFQTSNDVTAYEPRTGKVLWSLTGQGTSQVASPTQGEGLLLIAARQFLALRPGKELGGKPEIVWKSNKLSSGYTSPVYHQGRVYALTGVGLNCVDAKNGAFLWQQRIKGPFWASPVIADGKAYVANEDGLVTVIKLGKEPEVLATNDMKQAFLATPAIAGGAIYLRSDQTLFCVGPKKTEKQKQ
jgi:outer membrane protein assembly factor BamB